MKKDCLSCQYYISCPDSKKGFNYLCNKFKVFSSKISEKDFLASLKKSQTIKDDIVEQVVSTPGIEIPSNFNITDLIDKVIADNSVVPMDLKINDSDLPKAANFFEFATKDRFLGIKPYLEQLIIGTIVMSEYCPRCSDVEWLFTTHNVNDTFYKFSKKVCLLEHGKCPNCGSSKAKLVRRNELSFYQEFAVCAGQRCVTGDTLILTNNGLEYISNYIGNRPYGFSPLIFPISDGENLNNTASFYCAKPEKLLTVVTELGIRLTGTPEHPLLTKEGFKKISDLTVDDYLVVSYGQNIYGNQAIEKTPEEILSTDCISSSILSASKEYLTEYLKILFAKTQFNFNNERITCEVHSLLLNMGIVSSIQNNRILIDKDFIVDFLSLLVNNFDCAAGTYLTKIKYFIVGREEETYDVLIPGKHRFWTNGLISHNSGKSALTAMLCAYLTHRILKLQRPTDIYKLLSNSILHGIFVALTYAQAKDTLWEPYYNYITSSRWFTEYHHLLDSYSRKYNEELYKLKDTFVYYRFRSLIVYPAGPDKRVLRGRTRIFASVDELGWFDSNADSKKIKTNANEVYIALERSLLTIRASANRLIQSGFSDIPTGYFFNISSPESQHDKIMELVRKSEGSTKIFGLNKPTWEMNPDITFEDLAEEFKNDPVTALRDYGAEPPLSSNPFITSIDLIKKCFRTKGNGLRVTYQTDKKKDGTVTRYVGAINVRKTIYPSVVAFDAGAVNNSFGVVSAHLKDEIVVVDCIAEIMPLPGMPLNFTLIHQYLIEPLCLYQNAVYVTADRWNSLKILQDLAETFEITAKAYSLKYRDIFMVKTLMEQEQLRFPHPESKVETIINHDPSEYPQSFLMKPIDHLILQFLTVQNTGTKITKGDGKLTDDIFRALALAVYTLKDPDNKELFSKKEAVKRSEVSIGVTRGMSGIGNASANNSGFSGNTGISVGISKTRK